MSSIYRSRLDVAGIKTAVMAVSEKIVNVIVVNAYDVLIESSEDLTDSEKALASAAVESSRQNVMAQES
ncbi:MAG: hypothetical protein A2Y38_22355 [Spirochaetes bacterium GWB1_59_5]|nr:MAG: hypothetical protein A2Y38_22355 [Spirochaetes bacterium GWB1_59_5]